MKDLLKKKGNKPAKAANPKAKKPLFAKKGKPTKPTKKVTTLKTDGLDTKKIVFILLGLLVLVLGVLAARLFLFNNESAVETVYTPATAEEIEANQDTEPLQTETVDIDTADESVESPTESVVSNDAAVVQDENTAAITSSETDSTVQPMTLEEFKQEAATRVYRERNTAPQSQ